MFTTPFWPAADSYCIHMMNLPVADTLSPAALDLIHQATRLTEAASHIHPVATHTGSTLLQSIEDKLSIICFKPAHEFECFTVLAIAMTRSVLQDETAAAMQFLQRYFPHHQREEADQLLNPLDKTVDMIENDQKIKGFTL